MSAKAQSGIMAFSKAISVLAEVGIAVLSLFMGLIAKNWWQDLYMALNATPFNESDPLFGHDIAFYVFQLPLLNNLQSWIGLLFFTTLLMVAWIYFSKNILAYLFSSARSTGIKMHLFTLIALVILGVAAGFQIKLYGLLYSPDGAVFGAAYTDINATQFAYKFMQIALIAQAFVLMFWGFRGRLRVPLAGFGVIATGWIYLAFFILELCRIILWHQMKLKKSVPT